MIHVMHPSYRFIPETLLFLPYVVIEHAALGARFYATPVTDHLSGRVLSSAVFQPTGVPANADLVATGTGLPVLRDLLAALGTVERVTLGGTK